MEDIFGYILVLLAGFSALYIYQTRKSKKRLLPLSTQHYPELTLELLIQKQEGAIQNLILRIHAKKDLVIRKTQVELITTGKEIFAIPLNPVLEKTEMPFSLKKNNVQELLMDMKMFKSEIINVNQSFIEFRLAIENASGRKFKTHRLAFNKNWTIFKPDSGKFN